MARCGFAVADAVALAAGEALAPEEGEAVFFARAEAVSGRLIASSAMTAKLTSGALYFIVFIFTGFVIESADIDEGGPDSLQPI